MRALPCLLILACCALCSVPLPAQADNSDSARRALLTGSVVKVLDGDTLLVQLGKRHVRVHLSGVDAPEIDQPWGRQAANALSQMVLNQSVDMGPLRKDGFNRMTTIVFVGEEEVGAAMIRDGNAWADRDALRASDASLCDVEARAREARRGLWSLPAPQRVAPWEYRRRLMRRHFTDYSNETVTHCKGKH